MCTRQVAHHTFFLSRQRRHSIFLVWRVMCTHGFLLLPEFLQILIILSSAILTDIRHIMSSPGQRRGNCGHVMVSFDSRTHNTRCRDRGKGKNFCVENSDSSDYQICKSFTPEQRQQLATPSYKIKKEKREAKKLANLINKLNNTLSNGQLLIRSVQTGPPNTIKRRPVFPPNRPVQYCALARWRVILPSCLDRVTS